MTNNIKKLEFWAVTMNGEVRELMDDDVFGQLSRCVCKLGIVGDVAAE